MTAQQHREAARNPGQRERDRKFVRTGVWVTLASMGAWAAMFGLIALAAWADGNRAAATALGIYAAMMLTLPPLMAWATLTWVVRTTGHGQGGNSDNQADQPDRTSVESGGKGTYMPEMKEFERAAPRPCNSHEDEEDEGLKAAYTCPECGQDLCDSCTDLEAWLSGQVRMCPHCGHVPGYTRNR